MLPVDRLHYNQVRINNVWGLFVNLFFPPQCVYCKSSGELLCPTCAQQALPPKEPLCHRCGRSQPVPCAECNLCLRIDDWALTWVRAAALYTGPIQAATQALKYNGEKELARYLARYLAAAFCQNPWSNSLVSIDFAIPVPLHHERYSERGYNQAQLIADAFGSRVNVPVMSSYLSRIRYSESQVNLQFNERQSNVKDAFQTNGDLSNKKILLVDDVYTTGATLNECAKTLRNAGATAVYGLTLAMPNI